MQNDGVTNVTAGAKPGNDDPDSYEAETEETTSAPGDLLDDADTVVASGPGHSPAGVGQVSADDEESLLDASENDSANLPSGTDFPAADPAVKPMGSNPSGIADPTTTEASGLTDDDADLLDD